MKDFFKKIGKIEKEISSEKGDFNLFAALLREDSSDKWDIVISAPWLKKDDMASLKYIAKIIKKHLDNELLRLSRIVIIDNRDAALEAIHSSIQVKHGAEGVEVRNSNFFGLIIKHAYFVISQRTPTSRKSTRKVKTSGKAWDNG